MGPSCYLSFPDDQRSVVVETDLRAALRERGITVLPPSDQDSMTTSMRPFHWLRQADAVLVDITGDSSWVAYEAGAAQALNKRVMLVAQHVGASSPIEVELPRTFLYDPVHVTKLADYVHQELDRSLSTE